jgi:uncharacterized protein YndB with AHSA1/START domain
MTATDLKPGVSNVTRPSDRDIQIERVFDAPVDAVWRAHTEAELLAQWWGRGNKLDIEVLDVKPGGKWRFVEHSEGQTHGFGGTFREIVPQQRMSQTFEYDGMPGYVSLAIAEFEDLGDGRTKVKSSMLFWTPEERDGMAEAGMQGGMDQSYAALDKLLAKIS